MSAILAEITDNKKQVFSLKNKGKNVQEIAAETGLSASRVYEILRSKKTVKTRRNSGGNLRSKTQELLQENTLQITVENLQNSIALLQENFIQDRNNFTAQLAQKTQEFEAEILRQKQVFDLEFLRLKKVAEEAQKTNAELLQKLQDLEAQKTQEFERATALELQLKKERSFGASVMRFLHSDALVNGVMLIVSCALALGITSRIFIASGVQEIASYIIALGIDIAAFIFLSRGVHWGGMVFAFLAGVQVVIVTGHGWIPESWQVVVKSIALGCMVIGMIYGFGYLIAKSKK